MKMLKYQVNPNDVSDRSANHTLARAIVATLVLGKTNDVAKISSEHNDVIRSESAKMDYIRRLNITEISGSRRIVTELRIELPTYPSRDQV
ncbi:unnamed protein product [Brassica oleracea var. botrytis]